jgi:RNA polymerase sigma factor (sigma-70 family)
MQDICNMTIEEGLIAYDNLIVRLSKNNKVNGYDNDDLAQEFRMILIKCLKNFNKDKNVKFDTYFITACKNEISRLRRKNKDKALSLNEEINENEEYLDNVLDKSYQFNFDKKELEMFLSKEKYGEYAILYLIYNMKQSDIASKYNVSNVWVNLKIKELIEKVRNNRL